MNPLPQTDWPQTDLPANDDRASRLAINANWFAKLRWVAVVGQLVTISFVSWPLGIETPIQPLLLLIGVTTVSNLFYGWWASRHRKLQTASSTWQLVLASLMILDLIVLTAMLALTGGITNPFVIFYFVNLALSGVVLNARWAWVLSALAVAAFGLLTYGHAPIEELQDPNRLKSLRSLYAVGEHPPLSVLGAWIAFATAAIVIVNFITRLTSELRTSNRLRRRAEQHRARAEKLEALGTLAAGAAHELATPLSTIAVAAGEVQRDLEQSGQSPEAVADMRLIRSELVRCRTILDRMSTESGQPIAGLPQAMTAEDLVDEILDELPAQDRIDEVWEEESKGLPLFAPRVALAQAIRGVVQNGIDATDEVDPNAHLTLAIDRLAKTLRLTVTDQGPGMPAEILERASEPFFTTKSPGRGMGLGLFLATSVIERLGGSLRLESPASGGTIATIVLPLSDK